MFYTLIELSIDIRVDTLVLVSLPKCYPWPLVFFAIDSDLYASMHVLDVDECNMPRVCENASMSDNSHDCDAMLHESLGVVDIPNIKLLKKKRVKSLIRIWASYFVKMMIWLLSSMNPTNWLKNIKNLLKILLKS